MKFLVAVLLMVSGAQSASAAAVLEQKVMLCKSANDGTLAGFSLTLSDSQGLAWVTYKFNEAQLDWLVQNIRSAVAIRGGVIFGKTDLQFQAESSPKVERYVDCKNERMLINNKYLKALAAYQGRTLR